MMDMARPARSTTGAVVTPDPAGRFPVVSEARSELDSDPDRPALGGDTAHQHRAGEHAAGDLGDHRVGQHQLTAIDPPRGL
jgi:hypothetical protein